MMLPGMSGYEVIGRLKQDRRTHDIPIIVNSAYHVDETRLKKVNENAVIPILKKTHRTRHAQRENKGDVDGILRPETGTIIK